MGKCASKQKLKNVAEANMEPPLRESSEEPPAGGPGSRKEEELSRENLIRKFEEEAAGEDEKAPVFVPMLMAHAPAVPEAFRGRGYDDDPTPRPKDSLELHPVAVGQDSVGVPTMALGQSANGMIGTPVFNPQAGLSDQIPTYSLNPNQKQIDPRKLRSLTVQLKNPFKEVERRENIERIEAASARGEIPPYYPTAGPYILERKDDGSIYGRVNPSNDPGSLLSQTAYASYDRDGISDTTSEEERLRRKDRRRRRRERRRQADMLNLPSGAAIATPVSAPAGGDEPLPINGKSSRNKKSKVAISFSRVAKPPSAPSKEPGVQQQQMQRDPAVSPLPSAEKPSTKANEVVTPVAQKGQTTPEPKTRPIPAAAKQSVSRSSYPEASKDVHDEDSVEKFETPRKPNISALASMPRIEDEVAEGEPAGEPGADPPTSPKKKRKKKKKKRKKAVQTQMSAWQDQEDKYYSMDVTKPAYEPSPPPIGEKDIYDDERMPDEIPSIGQLLDSKGDTSTQMDSKGS